MKSTLKILLAVLVTLKIATGCQESKQRSIEIKPEKGSVSGRATDAKGFPLKGVAIRLSHTVWTDKSLSAVTDSSGFYKIVLPAEPRGNWNIQAEFATNAYNQRYAFTLDVDDNSSFGGVRGAIRNFKWRLSGENISGQYGATINIHQKHYLVPLNEVKLILSPLEEFLIDGSDAKAMEKTIENVGGSYVATDVPIGRYTVQALRDGKHLKLATGKTSRAKDTVEITFTGTTGGYNANLYLVN